MTNKYLDLLSRPPMLTVLQNGRALLSNEDNWTQFVMARDEDGMSVTVGDPKACQFCLTGALLRAEIELLQKANPEIESLLEILCCLPSSPSNRYSRDLGRNTPTYNDAEGQTHEAILDYLDDWIEEEQAVVNHAARAALNALGREFDGPNAP